MHFYAYLEYHKFLKESDRQEVGFFQSKSGYSPLDISLKMNFERCIETIYKITKRLSRKNVVFLFQSSRKCVTKLSTTIFHQSLC